MFDKNTVIRVSPSLLKKAGELFPGADIRVQSDSIFYRLGRAWRELVGDWVHIARPAEETTMLLNGNDYSLKIGDIVTHPSWDLGTLTVLDVNWALRAAALRLGDTDSVIVWPVTNLVKVPQ